MNKLLLLQTNLIDAHRTILCLTGLLIAVIVETKKSEERMMKLVQEDRYPLNNLLSPTLPDIDRYHAQVALRGKL